MPEKYDDEDEVGTGLYVLIGCAAVTVVLMYSWIGYTLYQGFKARRKKWRGGAARELAARKTLASPL